MTVTEPGRTVAVAIAGGSGAGKTTLATMIAHHYAQLGVTVLDHDSYYRDLSHVREEARLQRNFDDPDAIEHELLFEHLAALLAGTPVAKPRYSFATHTRSAEVDVVRPNPIVVVEGLFTLGEPRIRRAVDLRVFVDADADVRLIRRLRRDVIDRGRSTESVLTQYLASVRPMHQLHVAPSARHADLVLSGERLDAEFSNLCSILDRLVDSVRGAMTV
jgi:uridine kinase